MTDAMQRDAIVRMASDPAFAERVRNEPAAVARELGITEQQVAELAQLVDDGGNTSAELLGERLSKSAILGGNLLGSLLGEHASNAPPGGGNYEPTDPHGTPFPVSSHDVGFTGGVHDTHGFLSGGTPGDTHSFLSGGTPVHGGGDNGPAADGDALRPIVVPPGTGHDGGGDDGSTAPTLAAHGGAGQHVISPHGPNDPAAGKGPDGGDDGKPPKPDDGPKPPKLDAIDLDNSRAGYGGYIGHDSGVTFNTAHDPSAVHSAHDTASGKGPDDGGKPPKPDDGPKPPKDDLRDLDVNQASFNAAHSANAVHDPAASHSHLNDEAGGKKPDGGDDGGKPPKPDDGPKPPKDDIRDLNVDLNFNNANTAAPVEQSLLNQPGSG
jgi:hypothetical protein